MNPMNTDQEQPLPLIQLILMTPQLAVSHSSIISKLTKVDQSILMFLGTTKRCDNNPYYFLQLQ